MGKGSTVVATEAQIFVESALLTRVKQFTAKSKWEVREGGLRPETGLDVGTSVSVTYFRLPLQPTLMV